MRMEQGGDRPDDEVTGQDAESPESWYFDLPSGAWERQEEKNRELRRRVQSNIDEEPERVDPFVRKQDPEKAKGGRFSFGRKKDTVEEAPRETAGGTFRLQRGGAAGFGTLPPQMDDADDWSTEPDVPIALPHREFAPNEPVDSAKPAEDSPSYIEPDASNGTRWDATFGIESEASGDEEEDTIAGLRAWATRHEATERKVPFGQRLHVIPREADPDDEDDSTPEAEDAVSLVADTVEEAHPPVAPVFEPPKLGFVRRAAVEEVEEEVAEGGEESRWNQMFKGADEGGEGLAAMAEWAKKKAEEESDEPREIPEEFLKPFEWEQETSSSDALVETPQALAGAVDAETSEAPAEAFEAETDAETAAAELAEAGLATPEAEAPMAVEAAGDVSGDEIAKAVEPASALASFAEALAVMTEAEPDEPAAAESFDWEHEDAARVAEAPIDVVAGPVAIASDENDSEWDSSDLFPTTLQATVSEPKQEERKRGLLGRIFGRKKSDVHVEPEPAPSVSGGDWVPMDDVPAAALSSADANDDRSANPFADAAAMWTDGDDKPSAFVPNEAPEEPSDEKWERLGEGEKVSETEVESAPLPLLLRSRERAPEGLRDLPNDSFAWGAASEPAPANVVADVSAASTDVSEDADRQLPEVAEVVEASVEPKAPTWSWRAAAEGEPVATVEAEDSLLETAVTREVSAGDETPDGSGVVADRATEDEPVASVEGEADAVANIEAKPQADALEISEGATQSWNWQPEIAPVPDVEPAFETAAALAEDEEEGWNPEPFGAVVPTPDSTPEAGVSDAPQEPWSFAASADELVEEPEWAGLRDSDGIAAEFAEASADAAATGDAADGDLQVVAGVHSDEMAAPDHEAAWDAWIPIAEDAPGQAPSATAPINEAAEWDVVTQTEADVLAALAEAQETPPLATVAATEDFDSDDDDDDPWADFMASRGGPDTPREPSAAKWDSVFSGPERDVEAHPEGSEQAEAPPPETESDADDPWAAIAAASGYDRVSPSGAAIYSGFAEDSGDIAASLESQMAAAAEADAQFDWETEAAHELPLSTPESRSDGGEWRADDEHDLVLRAFEEHAATSDDNTDRETPEVSDAVFTSLLGDEAEELVSEPLPIEEARPFLRMQGWAPQRTTKPADPANAPWEPDGEANDDPAAVGPLPRWVQGPDDILPPPPWGTDALEDDDRNEAAAMVAGPSRAKTLARELVETGLLALLVFLAVRANFQNFKVDGTSMMPTLENGQFLIVNKIVYSQVNVGKLSNFLPFLDPGSQPERNVFHGPERGDIVVVVDPRKPDTDLIKRVIALPGESVEIADGHVYINDHLLEEPYIKAVWHDNRPKQVIPPNEYYVLGDNRDNSLDSRSSQVGLVPQDLIIGKAMISYWPKNKFGLAPNDGGNISLKDGPPEPTAQRINDGD